MSWRILAVGGMTVAGVLTSFVNTYLASLVFVCVPLLLISHKTVDQAATEEQAA